MRAKNIIAVIITLLIVFTGMMCRKEKIRVYEIMHVDINIKSPAELQARLIAGFNGAVAKCDSATSFVTRQAYENNKCEAFAQAGTMQAGFRAPYGSGRPKPFVDHSGDLSTIILTQNIPVYNDWNEISYRQVSPGRWRVAFNGVDILEYNQSYKLSSAVVAFGMLQSNTIRTIEWNPAFVFDGQPATEAYSTYVAIGGVEGNEQNERLALNVIRAGTQIRPITNNKLLFKQQ